MAQGQGSNPPPGGCWRCGNPHHKSWECTTLLDDGQAADFRYLQRQWFQSVNPQQKVRKDITSQQKFDERLQAKQSAEQIPVC